MNVRFGAGYDYLMHDLGHVVSASGLYVCQQLNCTSNFEAHDTAGEQRGRDFIFSPLLPCSSSVF